MHRVARWHRQRRAIKIHTETGTAHISMDLDEDFFESPESRVIVENMNQMTQKPWLKFPTERVKRRLVACSDARLPVHPSANGRKRHQYCYSRPPTMSENLAKHAEFPFDF